MKPCGKALWLQAREALWQSQSSDSRFFLCNPNCCFARCAAEGKKRPSIVLASPLPFPFISRSSLSILCTRPSELEQKIDCCKQGTRLANFIFSLGSLFLLDLFDLHGRQMFFGFESQRLDAWVISDLHGSVACLGRIRSFHWLFNGWGAGLGQRDWAQGCLIDRFCRGCGRPRGVHCSDLLLCASPEVCVVKLVGKHTKRLTARVHPGQVAGVAKAK